VQALVTAIEPSLTVEGDRPLSEVVQLLEERKLTALSVVQPNGILVGLLEKTAIIDLLKNGVAATPA
jgi:CBS domain-containing protein